MHNEDLFPREGTFLLWCSDLDRNHGDVFGSLENDLSRVRSPVGEQPIFRK